MRAPFHYKRGRGFGVGKGWEGYSIRDADSVHVCAVKDESAAIELIELLTVGAEHRAPRPEVESEDFDNAPTRAWG